MSQHENLKILAFVGLTGSGKSTAVEYMTSKGFPKVYFGGVLLKAVKDAGYDINEENERRFREELRVKEGKDFIVKRIIQEIHDLAGAGQHRIVADGLYTWTEYKALKHEFPGELTVVALITPRSVRYRRLNERPVRPLTDTEANARDWSEIENLEKGGPIAIADYYVMNDESVEGLDKQLDAICQKIGF